MRRSLLLFAVLAVGCGDNQPLAGDAAVGSDAAGSPALSATDDSGQPTTSIDFGSTMVGQGSTSTIHVTNTGSTTSSALALAITGAAADDYAIDNQLTSCAAADLAPGQSCTIALTFRPTAIGTRPATLAITGGAGIDLTIMLAGQGFAPDLQLVPSSLDFGQVQALTTVGGTITVSNQGSIDLPIDPIDVTGSEFSLAATTCGSTLAPGASCDLVLSFTPDALGSLSGTLTVGSGGTQATAALAGQGARSVTVHLQGPGTGTVTSTPAGIDCGTTCSATFETDVVLTATPDANSAVGSWSIGSCGSAMTCTVPGLSAANVTATFVTSGPGPDELAISFAGTAVGQVQVSDGTNVVTTCSGSCTVPITPGHTIGLVAISPETSTLSGGCNTAGGPARCSFVAAAGTTAITAAFSPDPKEQWTRLLGDPVIAVAHDGSGNIIAATANGNGTQATAGEVIKLSGAGATVWSQPILASAVATGPGDTVYVLSGSQLTKLDATGSTLWTASTDANSMTNCLQPYGGSAKCVAVASDGSVVVYGDVGLTRWDSDGNQVWSMSLAPLTPLPVTGLAIDAQGVIYATVDSGDINSELRFQPDGTQLASWACNTGWIGYSGIAIDSAGGMSCTSSYDGLIPFQRIDAAGTETYSAMFTGVSGSAIPTGVAADSLGNLAWWHLDAEPLDYAGASYVSVFGITGTPVWSLVRTFDYGPVGIVPMDASYHGGQLVLVGSYAGYPGGSGYHPVGWVQAYVP